jgi:hypothetical protein
MAAATENAQPVSALDGVYKPLPSAEGGNLRENGPLVDNENSCVTEKDMVDVHNGGRPPRPRPASMSAPTTVSIGGCITRALICEVALASDSIVEEGKDTSVMVQEGVQMEFQPVYRSGVWSDTGLRRVMEDAHVRIDDLETYLGSQGGGEASGAFYGVSAVFLAGSTSVLWTLLGENILGFCGEYVQYMRLNTTICCHFCSICQMVNSLF